MQVLNKEYYVAWREIPENAVRYWVRLWQDGFHSGSHPEWAFNPLTLTGLGLLWQLFSPVPGEPDWGRSQRHAIRVLASRRALFSDGIRFPSPIGDEIHRWNEYWTDVSASSAQFRIELFDRLTLLSVRPVIQTTARSQKLQLSWRANYCWLTIRITVLCVREAFSIRGVSKQSHT